MEVIKNYVDNVFAAYPQTTEVQALKRDMLASMEEKYHELRQNGKSEHEAAYGVIANFGSMDEIVAELGLKAASQTETAVLLSNEEAEEYIKKSKSSGLWIGIGVWLIIAGVSSVIITENAFIMFVAIAVAVTGFIINSSRMSAYSAYGETPIRLDSATRTHMENERKRFSAKATIMIASGVGVIILAVGTLAVLGESLNFGIGYSIQLNDMGAAIFLNIVAFAVLLFITAGSGNSAFNILLGKGDYANKEGVKKSSRIIGTIAAVYWPLMVALNMFLMFVVETDYFWVIWPIAGVVFAAIAGGIWVWQSTKEREK